MDVKIDVLDIAPDIKRTEEEYSVQSSVSFTAPYPALSDEEKHVYQQNLAGYSQIMVLADCLKIIDDAVATNNSKLIIDLFKKLNDVDIISDILGYTYNRISLEIDKLAYLNIEAAKALGAKEADKDTEVLDVAEENKEEEEK